MHICTTRVLTAAAIFAFAGQAMAVSWIDPTGGTFQDGTNWGGGFAPGVADVALFDLGGQTFTVNFTGNVTNTQLIIGRSDVTFDFAGFGYNLTQLSPSSIFIGELAFDTAVLTLTNGTLDGDDTIISQTFGSTGELNIPTGGALTLSGALFIGQGGDGSMNVTGGTVNSGIANIGVNDNSVGDVLLSGPTTVWTNFSTMTMGTGTSTLTVENGAVLNTNSLVLSLSAAGTSDIILDGPTSQINIDTTLVMSSSGGTSTMTVRNGADLTSGNGIIASLGVGTDAQFLITGAGSTWVSTDTISVGRAGVSPGGVLRIEDGAVVTSVDGAIGEFTNGQGAAFIDGVGSAWDMTGDLQIGLSGSTSGSQLLSITSGGVVSNANAVINSTPSSLPRDILVDGSGSVWTNTGAVTLGKRATLTIQNGGLVTSDIAAVNGILTLDGIDSQWQITNGLTINSTNTPVTTISNGAVLTSNGGTLNQADLLVSGGTWTNTGTLTVDNTFQSDLRITNGGIVTNLATTLVQTAGRIANVTVEGTGSRWHITGDMRLGDAADNGFGSGGVATLSIRDGGRVTNNNVVVATVATGSATILLENNDTLWDVSGNLVLGGLNFVTAGGTADLTIASGATAQVGATLKVHTGSNVQLLGGTLEVSSSTTFVVDDPNDFDFYFGTLRYTNNATFSLSDMQMILGIVPTLGPAKTIEVGGIATLNTSLIIDGGTFKVGQLQGSSDPLFLNGTLSLTNDSITVGAGGLLGTDLTLQSNRVLNVGNFVVVDFGSVLTVDQTTLTAGSLTNNGEVVLNGASAFIGGGDMDNFGRLTGGGRLGLSLTNQPGGVVLITSGNHLIAEGGQNFNSGRIDLAGGTLEFTQFTQNNTDGLIAGNGTIISRSFFVNDGDMAFSGATNFIGDITNSSTGLVLVTGVGPTTFFDDVTHNGEIRTSAGATAVFLGTVSGTGTYTGTGTNRFEGDFTPGASPADIAFGGDFVLTEFASLQIELAGGGGIPGIDFDRLNIAGEMDLGGTLLISLIGKYVPSLGDSFQVLIAGSRVGEFTSVLGLDLGGNLAFDVLYGLNDVTLQVISTAIAGDLDGNGFVDILDLNIVLANWNTDGSADPRADTDGSGLVDIIDLNVVLTDWNMGTPPGEAVPEPTTLVLLALGVPMLMRRRRG